MRDRSSVIRELRKWKILVAIQGAYHTAEYSFTQKDVLFIIGDWNAKVGRQEIPGITGIWP